MTNTNNPDNFRSDNFRSDNSRNKLRNPFKYGSIVDEPEIDFYGKGESPIEYKEINYRAYNMNERQIRALKYLEEKGRVNLSHYINLTGISKATAQRDLNDLLSKELIERKGRKGGGKYSYYVLLQK